MLAELANLNDCAVPLFKPRRRQLALVYDLLISNLSRHFQLTLIHYLPRASISKRLLILFYLLIDQIKIFSNSYSTPYNCTLYIVHRQLGETLREWVSPDRYTLEYYYYNNMSL